MVVVTLNFVCLHFLSFVFVAAAFFFSTNARHSSLMDMLKVFSVNINYNCAAIQLAGFEMEARRL